MTKTDSKETSNFIIKLCYEYPDLSYGFYWLLRARSGYRLDARIAKAAKIIESKCVLIFVPVVTVINNG